MAKSLPLCIANCIALRKKSRNNRWAVAVEGEGGGGWSLLNHLIIMMSHPATHPSPPLLQSRGVGVEGAKPSGLRHVAGNLREFFPTSPTSLCQKGVESFFFSFLIGVFEFLSDGRSNRSPVVREGAEPRRMRAQASAKAT